MVSCCGGPHHLAVNNERIFRMRATPLQAPQRGGGSIARAVSALQAARWRGAVAPKSVVPEKLDVAATLPLPRQPPRCSDVGGL